MRGKKKKKTIDKYLGKLLIYEMIYVLELCVKYIGHW